MDGNTMKSFHKDSIGFFLETEIEFIDLPENRCTIRVTYRINTHPFFKVFEAFFKRLFEKCFWATWEEDAPMRLRRWKVHNLGFKEFSGVDYINKKIPKPEHLDAGKYVFAPPSEPHPQSRRCKGSSGLSRRAWSWDTTSKRVPGPDLCRRKEI
jgi:hypothetical protein